MEWIKAFLKGWKEENKKDWWTIKDTLFFIFCVIVFWLFGDDIKAFIIALPAFINKTSLTINTLYNILNPLNNPVSFLNKI